MGNGHISGDLTNGLTQSCTYSFPIQTNLRCCQTNFPAGETTSKKIKKEVLLGEARLNSPSMVT